MKSATERLPEGLPEWFSRNDYDRDAQVAMSEYSSSWSASTLRDFRQFDLNDDGVITSSEALRATNDGAKRGASISSGIAKTGRPSSTPAELSAPSTPKPKLSLDERYLKYYQGIIAKYDKNKDGALAADEWASMKNNPAKADTDGDGRITAEELTVFNRKK